MADSSKIKIKALMNDVLLKIIEVLNMNLNLGLLTPHQCSLFSLFSRPDRRKSYIAEQKTEFLPLFNNDLQIIGWVVPKVTHLLSTTWGQAQISIRNPLLSKVHPWV